MKKIIVLIILNIICTSFLNCQQYFIDSLNRILKLKPDSEQVSIMNQMAIFYYSENNDSVISISHKALKLALKFKDKKNEINALTNLSFGYYFKGEIKKTVEFLNKAEILSRNENYKYGLANCYTLKGLVSTYNSEISEAYNHYNTALNIGKQLKNDYIIYHALNNIAVGFFALGDYSKLSEYLIKAYKIAKSNNDIGSYTLFAANLIESYYLRNEIDSAYIYIDEIKRNLAKYGMTMWSAISYNYIGLIYEAKTDYKNAIENYLLSYNILLKQKAYFRFTESIIYIVRVYLKENNFKKAKKYLDLASDVFTYINSREWKKVYFEVLSDFYYKTGNINKAFFLMKELKNLNDTIYSSNKSQINSLETKIFNEKHINEIESLQQKNRISELEVRNQKNNQYSMIAGLTLMFGIVCFVFFERRKSEKLLLNILPKSIAKRLKKGESTIADNFDEASVVFIDIVGFTKLSLSQGPDKTVNLLNKIYTEFDHIASKYGLEKIKTIGDCYMVASGIPNIRLDHAEAASKFALEAMNIFNDGKFDLDNYPKINFRCGIDCGPVVAGVIGENKFIYDLWGDTVNTASRMESNGVIGKIQVTERFKSVVGSRQLLDEVKSHQTLVFSQFKFEERGEIEIKGKGMMKTYFMSVI